MDLSKLSKEEQSYARQLHIIIKHTDTAVSREDAEFWLRILRELVSKRGSVIGLREQLRTAKMEQATETPFFHKSKVESLTRDRDEWKQATKDLIHVIRGLRYERV